MYDKEKQKVNTLKNLEPANILVNCNVTKTINHSSKEMHISLILLLCLMTDLDNKTQYRVMTYRILSKLKVLVLS